jgi:hypothetical protein
MWCHPRSVAVHVWLQPLLDPLQEQIGTGFLRQHHVIQIIIVTVAYCRRHKVVRSMPTWGHRPEESARHSGRWPQSFAQGCRLWILRTALAGEAETTVSDPNPVASGRYSTDDDPCWSASWLERTRWGIPGKSSILRLREYLFSQATDQQCVL